MGGTKTHMNIKWRNFSVVEFKKIIQIHTYLNKENSFSNHFQIKS